MTKSDQDRMPNIAYRMMSATFTLIDLFSNRVEQRVAQFDIREGMTVVDYGCGPGRYTTRFAKRVGEQGKVYAVDVQELAIEEVRRKMKSEGLINIIPVLARGYETTIPDHCAGRVFALDMFFGVKDPVALLDEIHRILRPEGVLILEDGHQSRKTTLEKVGWSGKWVVEEENPDHLRLRPE